MKAKHVEDTMKKGRFCFNHPSVFNRWENTQSAQSDIWDGYSSIIARDLVYAPIIQDNENGIVYGKIKPLADKANLHIQMDSSVYGKVDLHSLRHTYATRLIESGVPAKVLQKILGHTDINITLNVYSSVFEKYSNEHLAIADEYMRSNNLEIA